MQGEPEAPGASFVALCKLVTSAVVVTRRVSEEASVVALCNLVARLCGSAWQPMQAWLRLAEMHP